MAINLNTLAKSSARSTELSELMAYADLSEALHKKSQSGVDTALSQIGKQTDSAQEYALLVALLNSNWPEGFDKVVEHFDLERDGVNKLAQYCDNSLLEEFVEARAFDVVEHLWGRSSQEDQEMCIKHRLSFNLAQVLVKVGESEVLTDLASTSGEEQKVNILLTNCIELLDRAQVSGATREWSDRLTDEVGDSFLLAQPLGGSESEKAADLLATEGAIKALLDSHTPSVIRCFWQSVSVADNVEVFKRLIEHGVVGSEHTEVKECPVNFLEKQSGFDAGRISNKWIKEGGYSNGWLPASQETHTFNLAEIVCLFSRKSVRVLGQCLSNEEFRSALMKSSFAKHALVSGTEQRGLLGVRLYAELAEQGGDVKELVDDSGNTPLHIAAKYYQPRESAKKLLRELLKICPEWADAKNETGKTVSDIVDRSSQDEILSMVDEALISRIVKRRQSQEKAVIKASQDPKSKHRV